ncbi:methyl-directed mismatch repair (MMR) protein, mutL [Candidatus Protochlamydia naegleriophila]|uniref:DNA mismatch repair protein MutL n=1 Tax=Candidatus Protochlamydia naegleriophila TaxID=389348 RepID=A0A0U5EPI0_9BACT|nr:DNA mismatch repair endonuclease MutL [Candidatus Protochlamydia naegleriophila]CUI15761.1 methyl-directed mismatch repair (MMR) protein, mutL [Candidatus Protochlamydia naegleriophila]
MSFSSKIRVLSDQAINQIAAGEVIENPASVVKELVENSIDAGSTDICIEIQGGGRQLIRISDNGSGMFPDDALLSLERHATSKIREAGDIQDILTMGFRGEAIPSIASISKFTLLTCPQSEDKSLTGTLILVDGGRILSHSPAARSPGTTIEVKSLFFNVPVRRKFQRSPNYDTQEIVKIITSLALGHPTIQFELISDQKSLLKTPPISHDNSFQDLLFKRIECLLGKEFASALCPVSFSQAPYELQGFIGLPSVHKPNRTGQYLFINQRAVYSPLIGVAVREGYGTMLGTNRYPVFILHLNLPGAFLDVNVHPQKKEVRLRQEQKLKETLIEAVQSALRQEGSSFTDIAIKAEESDVFSSIANSYASLLSPFSNAATSFHVQEEEWEYKANPIEPHTSTPNSSPSFIPSFSPIPQVTLAEPTIRTRVIPPKEEPPALLASLVNKAPPRVAFPLLGYIILDSFSIEGAHAATMIKKESGGLCLLNQKAAYARITYEKLLKRASLAIQSLLIPLTLQFSAPETALLKEYLEPLNQLGFSIREFGDQTFVLDAFPTVIKQEEIETYLLNMIQDLLTRQETRQLQIKMEEKLALAACRASLPKTKRLTNEEAQGLVDQLFACQNPYQCPMGTQILSYLSPDELATFFVS